MTMARPGASKVSSALGTISSSFFSSGACPRTRSGTNRATSAVSSHRFTASPSVDEYHEGHVTSPEVNVNQVGLVGITGFPVLYLFFPTPASVGITQELVMTPKTV